MRKLKMMATCTYKIREVLPALMTNIINGRTRGRKIRINNGLTVTRK